MKFKVGTRGSQLAIVQCKAFLQDLGFHTHDYDLVVIKTTGDVRQEERFTEMGVKGIFTKELDEALLRKEIHFAVHSFKDLPSQLHPDIHLVAVSPCLDARDAFVSKKYASIDDLPPGAVIGSSSVRRHAQISAHRPDLIVKELRGNVETRIRKMKDGEYDAVLLAAAGLKRIGQENEIRSFLDPKKFVPCVGQGILAVTSLKSNTDVEKVLKKKRNFDAMSIALLLHDFMVKAQGGCSVPLGCYLEAKTDIIDMWGYLSDPQGKQVILEHVSLASDQKFLIVNKLLEKMEKKGFRELLKSNHDSQSSTQK